ncbi:hypothetical protein [Candidatus Halocynthiibacter alkanivorans]|uniref:hypothetical protein n=1 Tax=Candidatus Halocynthiibacter alkanivorans TaxID=2267619 RepID=UPI000DF2E5D1|nr:hypothetical protein [Candidatus Halocynthiibacter alkanivorans]
MVKFMRGVMALVLLTTLSACAVDAKLEPAPEPLGDFRFGYNVVITKNMQKGPFSRDASEEMIKTAIQEAMDARFKPFEGEKLYHIGLNVDAYALAGPGVPLLFKPRSVLAVSVSVFDDASRSKLNADPKLITAFEGISGETLLIGSGLMRTKEKQLEILSVNLAAKVEDYLRENGTWFGMDPADIPAPSEDEGVAALQAPEETQPEGN